MRNIVPSYVRVALSLAGSAILLFSCGGRGDVLDTSGDERIMTEYCEDLSIVVSRNGQRSYFFSTPLLEGYSLAREPYREFRRGVKIVTYLDDSLSTIDGTLTANYAINYPERQLWETRGDVRVEKSDGKRLYTQQLFWNERTGRIYSNVDTRIVTEGGRSDMTGQGFESDDSFRDWRFRYSSGRMEVDVTPTEPSDSTADGRPAGPAASASGSAPSPAAAQPPRRSPAPDVAAPSPQADRTATRQTDRPADRQSDRPAPTAALRRDSTAASRPAPVRRPDARPVNR